MHLDHIGIAVSDLEQAIETYEQILDTKCYKREQVEEQQVVTAFLQTGESKVELLGATDPESAIQKFLDKKGEGMHHVAFEVDDIYQALKRVRQQGFTLIHEEPVPGADNKMVAFVHPKDNHGVLIEFCQSRDER